MQLSRHSRVRDAAADFEGRSSLRTYATGILKFKIVDALRKRGREVPIEPLAEQSMDDAMDALFAADGYWRECLDTPCFVGQR